MKIPVYAFFGFLESGKTTFISEALGRDFMDGQRSLLICCETGEEEYDERLLKRAKTEMIEVDSEEAFTVEFIKSAVSTHRPDRIIIEYNGMWSVSDLYDKLEAAKVELYQTIMTVDGETFAMYLKNMRSLAIEMFKISEVVIFNKCTRNMNINSFRSTVKAANPRAQVGFDMVDGTSPDAIELLPFDVKASVIEIADDDYGIFHMDLMEHPERYSGKVVRFKAIVCKTDKMKEGFVPGRFAMTCCADDIQFIGYMAKVPKISPLPAVANRDWIMFTATVKYEFAREYRGKGPIYYPVEITPSEKPEEDVVYF